MKKYKVYGLPTKDAAWLSYLVEDDNQQLWDRKYKKLSIRRKRPLRKELL